MLKRTTRVEEKVNSNMQLLQTGSLTAQLNILKDPKTRFFWVQSPIAPRYLYLLHTKQKQIKKAIEKQLFGTWCSLSTEIHSENPLKIDSMAVGGSKLRFCQFKQKKPFFIAI